MVFRSAFNFSHDVVSPVGSRYKNVYLVTQDGRGIHRKLIEEVDNYLVIQSYAPTCDVHEILGRYAQSQDPSLLFRRAGVYADVSGLPKNLSEAILATDRARKAYADLDPLVRDHISFDELLADPGKLNVVIERIYNPPQKEDVKPNA